MITYLLSLVWIGALIGVSFLATPVKFQAESLTLPVALEVGRVTFRLFSKVECMLGIALLLASIRGSAGQFNIAAISTAGACLGILALQAFWVRPHLDARVERVISGETPPPSVGHKVYVTLEVAKLALLIATAAAAWG